MEDDDVIETFVSFVPRHGKLGFGEAASRIYSFFLRVSHNYSNGKFCHLHFSFQKLSLSI